MTTLHDFLEQLLDQGKIVFRSRRAPHDRPTTRDIELLAAAFESFCISVAGPRIPFDQEVAAAAAEFVRQASFALVNRDDRMRVLEKRLKMPGIPSTPAHHLSADLLLRYVPQIVRRARGLDPSDPLIGLLINVLRRWPLSGVLCEIEQGPSIPLDFAGHPGVLLLYAERLIENDQPAWRPQPPGMAWEYYELVLGEHGRSARPARTATSSR